MLEGGGLLKLHSQEAAATGKERNIRGTFF
jgi:hypothetical protein